MPRVSAAARSAVIAEPPRLRAPSSLSETTDALDALSPYVTLIPRTPVRARGRSHKGIERHSASFFNDFNDAYDALL